MNPTDPTHTPSGVLFGAAYYAEYHREERTEADLDLMKAAGIHGDPRRRVGLVDVGTARRRVRPRLAPARARRRPRARHRGDPRDAHVRRAAVAADGVPRDRRRAAHGRARAVGRTAGGRLLAPRLPIPRRARHPRGHRALRGPPRRDRLPGRQRAGHAALPQPRQLPAVRAPAEGAVRRRRDAQPRVGPHLLVAPAVGLVGPLDARRQHAARSTTWRGGGTRPTSRPSSSPGRPASCASTPAPSSS